jgi:1-phosphatidylinositol phosphodiesterase
MQQLVRLLWLAVCPLLALSLQFYSHKGSTLSRPDWMGQLDSGIPLRKLSIIGSHSSMGTGAWGDAFQTQSNTLANQMVMGMRALDIRCRHYQDQLKVYDRIASLNADLAGVLTTVRAFLQAHPLEAILIHIVPEGSPSANSGTF